MAVYRPKRNGHASKFYVCEFVYQGKRFQESTAATTKTVAKEYEKRRKAELERAAAGMPSEQQASRIRTVAEIIRPYLENYRLNHRAGSITFAQQRLAWVEKRLGGVLLSDLTENRVRDYIRGRQGDGAAGRTINMELGELSRAIGQPWSLLWPKVRKLEERKDVGRALSADEQGRLLDAVAALRSPVIRTAVPVLMLTGMRSGEALSLNWGQVNLFERTIMVGRAKTASGTGRIIPINDDLSNVLAHHRAWFVDRFGDPQPEQAVFPFGSPQPTDPNRSVTDISSGWDLVRKQAGVCCRLHDLRHTFCTRLAEAGVPESTMLALMGHMSRSMLERYSHIRVLAKREAVAAVTLRPHKAGSEGVPVKVPVPTDSVRVQ
jgi:integrase